MQKKEQILQQLAAIVNPEQIQPWSTIDVPLQDQISQAIAPTHTPSGIVYPHTQAELGTIMASAHQHHWTVLPCGNGSKLHWGGQAQSVDVIVSTARLTQIIEHAVGDLTVTVEPGITFSALQAHLAAKGQFLALDPCYPEVATLGGIVATANAGFLRQRYGGVRDMLIGVSMVRTDGQSAKAGGRVVKNVAGYDLMKLLTGSWGTLGIISQMTLRLYPQPPASQTLCLTGSHEAVQRVGAALLESSLTPTAATVVAPATAQGLGLGPRLALLTRFQSIPISVEQQVKQMEAWGTQQALTTTLWDGSAESIGWQQLRAQLETSFTHTRQKDSSSSDESIAVVPTTSEPITCKVGVLPAQAVFTLHQMHQEINDLQGWINTGSGIGMIQFSPPSYETINQVAERIRTMRSLCEEGGGFLTVLEAPTDLKQHIDIWGYVGNALPMMNRIKQQFDPTACLSPSRFLV